jgi:hypothetical protein
MPPVLQLSSLFRLTPALHLRTNRRLWTRIPKKFYPPYLSCPTPLRLPAFHRNQHGAQTAGALPGLRLLSRRACSSHSLLLPPTRGYPNCSLPSPPCAPPLMSSTSPEPRQLLHGPPPLLDSTRRLHPRRPGTPGPRRALLSPMPIYASPWHPATPPPPRRYRLHGSATLDSRHSAARKCLSVGHPVGLRPSDRSYPAATNSDQAPFRSPPCGTLLQNYARPLAAARLCALPLHRQSVAALPWTLRPPPRSGVSFLRFDVVPPGGGPARACLRPALAANLAFPCLPGRALTTGGYGASAPIRHRAGPRLPRVAGAPARRLRQAVCASSPLHNFFASRTLHSSF